MNIQVTRTSNMKVRVSGADDGGFLESQSIEANLLFAILEKLEELRIGVQNVDQGISEIGDYRER